MNNPYAFQEDKSKKMTGLLGLGAKKTVVRPRHKCLDCPALITGGGKVRCSPCSYDNAMRNTRIRNKKK